MEIKEFVLKGVFLVSLNPLIDERGFFMRTYDVEFFEKAGINYKWVQENHSSSKLKGIIRGLHFQLPPFTETKLIRCIKGSVLDVFLDLRAGSETFGQWDSVELSEENKKMILLPRGFAHGYCTLTDISEVLYKVDSVYSPQYECGILWNDKTLNINWPTNDPVLSGKDFKNMTLTEFTNKYGGIEV
jgi:dTDP-4-dehydrorhamnose 3,5-epimerase